jgi:hypothetical protein
LIKPLFDRGGRPAADPAMPQVLRSQSPHATKAPAHLAFLGWGDGDGDSDIVNRLRGSKVISSTSLDARSGFL